MPDGSDIDDLIERWHKGDGEGMELYEYLGMSLDEYRRWVEGGPAIPLVQQPVTGED